MYVVTATASAPLKYGINLSISIVFIHLIIKIVSFTTTIDFKEVVVLILWFGFVFRSKYIIG